MSNESDHNSCIVSVCSCTGQPLQEWSSHKWTAPSPNGVITVHWSIAQSATQLREVEYYHDQEMLFQALHQLQIFVSACIVLIKLQYTCKVSILINLFIQLLLA